jgi:hypothetical protein
VNDMTTKHTPGPWQVKPAAGGNLFICSSSRKPSIAGVALTAIGIDREESEANAKLIAAAPDLLNALQGVMDWWMNDTDGAEEMPRELFDDGDALRLAVKLWLATSVCADYTVILGVFSDGKNIREEHGDDPYTATRRAIVRAAAEIGLLTPNG